ncbi:hypothetical protein O181_054359 [Austropuccinia psidii MF-1]|uniref:Uncharacterized protein n=1 Tax=Austropuccinia psidii MF-1 TaxID=1389203 RepID=A0A9Q3HTL4_9BASI|nr:hypothetical protein [Austropuccinia psidii MF-1]
MISPVPSSINMSSPPPMVTSLLNRSEVVIRPMKDGNGKRTFELGPIVTMSCHPWDSKTKNKTHRIPPDKTHLFHICLVSKPCGNPLQAQVAPNGWRTHPVNLSPFVEPSQHNEPPIPGPSPYSKPPEDILPCEPEPEVAPTQSMEEPFARPATPCSIIFINYTPIGTPPPLSASLTPPPSPCVPPPPSAKLPSFP